MNKEHSCHLVSQFYSQHSSLAGLLLAVKVVILRVPAAGNKLPLEHAFHPLAFSQKTNKHPLATRVQ
jgi:hypothetical protein